MASERGRETKEDLELEIVRVFDAPRDAVYAAWTDRDSLAQWSAPYGFLITHYEGAMRPGGVWRSAMRSSEGDELWLGGRYLELVPNERLSFTHGWERHGGQPVHETLVTVELEDDDGRTRMTFRQERFESAETRDGHRNRWSQSFERLDDLLDRVRRDENQPRRRVVGSR